VINCFQFCFNVAFNFKLRRYNLMELVESHAATLAR